MAPNNPPRWKVAATVSFYILSALSMVMINKWVLRTSNIPLTFLGLQILITILFLYLVRLLNLLEFKLPFAIPWETVKGLKYLTLLNVLGLIFNTYTLVLVDASFYQVARGLVLPLTVLASLIFLSSHPSTKILFACAVVTLGFLLGILPIPGLSSASASWNVRGFTPLGIFFGLASSASTAMHVVVIKQSLATVKNSVMDLAWYSNILTLVMILPLIGVLETGKAVEFFTTASSADLGKFWLGTFATGLGGFLISVAGILSVKVTSPITHMVSSAARGVLQTGLGIWFFGDILTVNKTLSVGTILAGSVWYTWIKHVESLPPSLALPLSSSSSASSTPTETHPPANPNMLEKGLSSLLAKVSSSSSSRGMGGAGGRYQRVPGGEISKDTPDLDEFEEEDVVFDADVEEMEMREKVVEGDLESGRRRV